ncbi:MAG: hypothetical protein ACYSWQ_11580 [Planctomycetota bacterium]
MTHKDATEPAADVLSPMGKTLTAEYEGEEYKCVIPRIFYLKVKRDGEK